MVEAVVHIIVEHLLGATTQWMKDEVSLINGVENEVDNILTKMKLIQQVLDKAQNKNMKDVVVKKWLEELQEISYDMDDIVDEWNTRALIQEAKVDEDNNASTEISGSSSSSNFTCLSYKYLNCFRPIKKFGWRHDIALRIRVINEKMNLIYSEIENLNSLKKVLDTNVTSETNDTISRTTTSSIKESQIHGRDKDQTILLHKILSKGNNMLVIPIVGAGGLGKTTLAQLVYNNEEVRKRFHDRIWVCVSSPFDEVRVAQGILEGMKVGHLGTTCLQTLHDLIEESVCGKKFLLVLDDVWEEDQEKWQRLQRRLEFGALESRIMVTTRSEEVAKKMSTKTTDIFKPPFISTSDCWLLMCEAAFKGKSDEDIAKLEDIGKSIAHKCKGLPLAAKVLGSLLWSKDTREEWEQVLKSEIWSLENAKMELFPHIFLSYKELSSPLKRFFSLCALFPKDYIIEDKFLISYWMAQTPLHSEIPEENMILTGKQHIKDLKSRAFLEGESYLDHSLVKMHSIMHDFALYLSGHEFLSLTEVDNNDNKEAQAYVNMKTRHLFFSGEINPTAFFDVRKLRSCHAFGLKKDVALDLFKQLKFVRTLNLQRCFIKEVPESIGRLIHLRTLDLRHNYMLYCLPEATGELYNLQYIWLDDFRSSSFFPKSLSKLINLQRLDKFAVEMGESCLATLGNLNKLRGTLCIEFASDYANETDAEDAKLSSKKHITEVNFDLNYFEVTNGVLEALRPAPGVQILSIRNLVGETLLPDWITSLRNLTQIEIADVYNLDDLPVLGKFACLQVLSLQFLPSLRCIGRHFLGIDNDNKETFDVFPKLVTFTLRFCNELSKWEDIVAEIADTIKVLPKLECLIIENCPKLQVLPHRLLGKAHRLKKLEITSCQLLEESIKKDQQPILHIKEIHINGTQLIHKSTRS